MNFLKCHLLSASSFPECKGKNTMTARENSIASKRKPAIFSALGFEHKEVLVLMNFKSYQITITAL